MLYLFWALVGWCGTPWRGWPPPPPDPWWWIMKVLAVVGGIVGGLLVDRYLTVPDSAPALIATAIGAYAGGRFLAEAVGIIVVGGRGVGPNVTTRDN